MKRIGTSIIALSLATSLAIAPQATAQDNEAPETAPVTTSDAATQTDPTGAEGAEDTPVALTTIPQTEIEDTYLQLQDNNRPQEIQLDGATWYLSRANTNFYVRTLDQVVDNLDNVPAEDKRSADEIITYLDGLLTVPSKYSIEDANFDAAAARAVLEALKSDNPPAVVEVNGTTLYQVQARPEWYVADQTLAATNPAHIDRTEVITLDNLIAAYEEALAAVDENNEAESTLDLSRLSAAALAVLGLGALTLGSSSAGSSNAAPSTTAAQPAGKDAQATKGTETAKAADAKRGVAAQTGVSAGASALAALTLLSVIGAAAFVARRRLAL